ncbi:MAG TPA: universal stress protein [Streptosporangiaceae bacterium]|nr:universal stress protein [Streptosporangiaceae bacterium]
MTAGPFRRVLVGWDASADAAEALCAAASIVRGGAGHVVALTVVPAAHEIEAADEQEGERAAIRRRAEERFERVRESAAAGVRMSLQIVEGRQVGTAVCAYAAEHGFDLLVLGRHGDGAPLRPRLGRVAEVAARGSAVPVLLLSAP